MIVRLTHLGFLLDVRLENKRAKVLTPMPAQFAARLERGLVDIARTKLDKYFASDDAHNAAWAVAIPAEVIETETRQAPKFDPEVIY